MEDKLTKLERINDLIPNLGLTEIFGAGVPETLSTITDPITGGDRRAREEFRSINAMLLSEITKEQKGNQSDKDMMIWQKTIPDLKTSPEGLKIIYERRKAIEQRNLQAAEFREDSIDNGMSVKEAKEVWKRAVNDKPLFDDEGNIMEENVNIY